MLWLKLLVTLKALVLEEVAKEVCMQVAAANPLFLSKEQVDNEALEKEKEIYRVQALNEGKPENIVEKMVNGKNSKVLQRSLSFRSSMG